MEDIKLDNGWFDEYQFYLHNFCKCKYPHGNSVDTETSEFGYWFVCNECGLRIEDDFHYYNHYDGEDHDDLDIYD